MKKFSFRYSSIVMPAGFIPVFPIAHNAWNKDSSESCTRDQRFRGSESPFCLNEAACLYFYDAQSRWNNISHNLEMWRGLRATIFRGGRVLTLNVLKAAQKLHWVSGWSGKPEIRWQCAFRGACGGEVREFRRDKPQR